MTRGPKKSSQKTRAAYARRRERARLREADIASAGQEIPPIPPISDPYRRGLCRASLQRFLETYLLSMFSDPDTGEHWPWSDDLLLAIERIERAILHGERFALAMPRGGAKSGLLTGGTLWGVLNGHAPWVCLLAANGPMANKFGLDIKTILHTNELLAGDYPEVCFPLAQHNGINNRHLSYLGHDVRITWTDSAIVLPDIPGSRAAQSRITWAGLDSSGVRGQRAVLPDGRQIRPSVALIDDPQTIESAHSALQTGRRVELLQGDVLMMGPPGRPLSALMAMTVISPNDMADQILKDARWHGLRTQMLKSFPVHRAQTPPDVTHGDWWDKYGIFYRNGEQAKADALYADHRCLPECEERLDRERPCGECPRRMDCMDAEAVVSWRHRKYPKELSAVQHAMNKYFNSPSAFMAEMQQDPMPPMIGGTRRLNPADVCRRLSGLDRGIVAAEMTHLTGFVDVHDRLLYWMVVAWREDFSGQVIDFGTWPDQPTAYFSESDPPHPLEHLYPGAGKEGVLLAGLAAICSTLLQRRFSGTSGGVRQLERLLVDANYKRPIAVAAKRKVNSSSLWLRHGIGITAGKKPINLYERKPGWQIGDGWYIPPIARGQEYQHVVVDVNLWKSFCASHLAIAPGDPGAITLFGRPGHEQQHRHLANHLAGSEYYRSTSGMGRDVEEWHALPGGSDNHWWDCLVGCAAAASMVGCRTPGSEAPPSSKRKVYTQADLRRRR